MTDPHYGAREASTDDPIAMAITPHPVPSSRPAAPPPRARRRPRALLALTMGLALALVAALPAAAAWPVANRYSRVSQYYHRSHHAIDIAATTGTPIVPIWSGRTVFAGWRNNGGGWQVWVSNGNGWYTAYYHMSREASYRGEYVSGGREIIGYVGQTGNASGSHLHVEVWRGFPWRSGSYRVNPWTAVDHGSYLPYRYR